MVIELIRGLEIKIEFLTDDVINFHITKNTVLRGKEALRYFKWVFDEIFNSGVRLVLISLPKRSEARHIRLMALRAGFKKHTEIDNNIIYYLIKGSD